MDGDQNEMQPSRLRDHRGLQRLADDHRAVVGAVLAVGVVVAWLTRWMVDDAYISFRYSKNLASGEGLVFNPGERVEGYTNFLWTLIHALPESLGLDPLAFSHFVGLICYVGVVIASYELARRFFRNEALSLVALVLVAWNGTLIRFSTSGMETALQVMLVMATVLAFVEPDGSWTVNPKRLAAASTLAGVALLTRLDSALVLGVWFGYYVAARRSNIVRRPERGLALVLPGLAIVVPWLWWKHSYYGALLPNTLAAKSGGVRWQMLLFGLVYLILFALSYALFLLVGRARRTRLALDGMPLAAPTLATIGLWSLYVVWVGGDWMEFRFMTVLVPFVGLVVTALLDPIRSVLRHTAVFGVLAAFSLLHVIPSPISFGVFSPGAMDHGARELRAVGEELQARFPGSIDERSRPLMAIGAAGALAYYSELRSIDMLGLTDATVARTGEQARRYFPGHQIIAPLDYLVDRKVNLVLVMDGPIAVDPDRSSYRLSELVNYYPVVDLRDLPTGASVVEIPSSIGVVRAIYLTRHPEVDALVDGGEWKRFPIDRTCRSADLAGYISWFGTKTCST